MFLRDKVQYFNIKPKHAMIHVHGGLFRQNPVCLRLKIYGHLNDCTVFVRLELCSVLENLLVCVNLSLSTFPTVNHNVKK